MLYKHNNVENIVVSASHVVKVGTVLAYTLFQNSSNCGTNSHVTVQKLKSKLTSIKYTNYIQL